MGPIHGFAGEQVTPSDGRYDEVRAVFNAMVDRHPALIARCTSPDDAALAIAYARDAGLPLAVRAGGHSVAGLSMVDDGVVIDLRPLAKVSIDARNRIATVGAGALWGELDRASQGYGLATTGGRISTTGVAGFTLGGGSGWLERRHGLAVDNLLAVELVTAEGDRIRASEYEHPDLLWAHRGGGGNFGVVTELELRLHEVGPMVYGGIALYDAADGERVVTALRDFYAGAPDESGVALGFITAPPAPFVPEEWHGRLVTGLVGMWTGPVEQGEAVLRELLASARPIVNVFGEMPYAELQSMIDVPPGLRNWYTAEYLMDLPDAAVHAYCEYSHGIPLGHAQSLLVPWGGAVARGGDTPMTNRDAGWVVHPFCAWEEEARDEEHIAWGRRVRDVFADYRTGATYLNFIGDEGADRIRAAFGPNYDRLAAVKATWDADNVFRGNQNVLPAGAAA